MKKAFFNIAVYTMLGYSILSALYMGIPDMQALVPGLDSVTAIVSGGSTLLLGSGGLAVQSWLSKTRSQSDTKYALLAEKFLTLVDKYSALENKYQVVENVMNRTNALLEAQLETKLDNPLLTAKARDIIEGVLHEKDTV